MKKIIILVFFTGVLASCSDNINVKTNKNFSTNNQVIEQQVENKQVSNLNFISLEEVKKHNKNSDCWTIIENKVYNITSFFGKHPGGDENLIKVCGKEASEIFNNKHGENNKSKNKLKEFYIGDLKIN